MHEVELKFGIPPENTQKIQKQINTKTAHQQKLLAYYFDTPEKALGKQGIAIRIRFEDNQWVQTLKAHGDGITKRIEINHILPLDATSPETLDITTLKPDLSLIEQEDILKKLNKILPIEQLNQELVIQYYTDIDRISRKTKKNQSTIEIAYDTGKVGAGDNPDNHQPIHEIEFELVQGDINDLLEVAQTWVNRHQLYFSTISKAERGSLLLKNKAFAKPVKANLSQLQSDKNISQQQFLQQVVSNCLLQILPNATAIAEGSPDGNHVHQLRVGIRRLRTALKSFKKFSELLDPTWQQTLKQTFCLLGEYRDKEILISKTQPMLEQQGSPVISWDTMQTHLPADVVKANEFQLLLLALMKFTLLPAVEDSPKAKKTISKKLTKLFNEIVEASENFANLETEQQHEIRKNLKTLRYLSEFAVPLYASRKQAKAFMKYLEPIQDVLGEYNDNAVGYTHYLEKSKTDLNALFAVGWFVGQEQQHAKACEHCLKVMKNAKKFW